MARKRVFVSFDYDHDLDLKNLLVGQARHSDTPFDIADWSMKESVPTNWKDTAREKIKRAEIVAVICGTATHTAAGVAAEVKIAQEEGKPYFLLWGRADKTCTKPTSAKSTDKVYKWTWDNLKSLIGGSR
jgi:hypothetical protein